MVARFVMVLMLAFVSLPQGAGAAPSVATCHEMGVPAHHRAPSPATPVDHQCIGCIPPGDWLGARVAAPAMVAAVPPLAIVRGLRLGGARAPALPPPRNG